MEGPSLKILEEELLRFVDRRLVRCSGTARIDTSSFKGQMLRSVRTWGKHLLLCFETLTVKVHFLMFGSYRIDETRAGKVPRLSLEFENGALHLYASSIQLLPQAIDSLYDWRIDLMSPQWDEKHVRKLLKPVGSELVCDVLMDQSIFAGAGNIIKNEVLFNLRLHPEEILGTLSPRTRSKLIREMREYCFQFYRWKKAYVLKKHWQIYRKRVCPICGEAVALKKTGRLKRVSFWCERCQPRRAKSDRRAVR